LTATRRARPSGGYTLPRATDQIQGCARSVDCSVCSLWHAVQSVVDEVLSKTTLQDLLRTEHEMNSWVKGIPGNNQLTFIQ